MKLNTLITVLLLSLSLGWTGRADTAEFDVYLLIGQSNMSGRGYLFPKDRVVMDGVFLLNDRDEIIPAKEPLNIYSSVRKEASLQGMNLGGSFARDIHRATGRKILLVVNARSGTSARLWQKGGDRDRANQKWDDLFADGEYVPSLYDEAVRRARTAMQYGELKGILFHQGENDSHEKYAPLWLDKVAALAADLRRDLGADLPFVVGETLHNFKRADIINPYIRDIGTAVPNSAWVSALGCNSNKDNLHFSRQGVTLLGHRYAEKILTMVYGLSPEEAASYCNQDAVAPYAACPGDADGLYTLCDFDNRSVEFPEAGARFSVVSNPAPDDLNPSVLCGRIKLGNGTNDCVGFAPGCPYDFTGGRAEISIKLISPKAGSSVKLKLMPAAKDLCEPVFLSATTVSEGIWEEVVFDLSEHISKCNILKKTYLICDAGTRTDNIWYFDDILIPDDDLSAISLFQRACPPMLPDKSQAWMSNSIANPHVLTPDKTLDGKWWLLVRGGDSKRSHLGYCTQDTATFNPLGPWDFHKGNPVIPAGWHGDDSYQAIDPCGLTEDGTFYLYYKGQKNSSSNTVLIGTTRDGETFTPVRKPWKDFCGVADVVKWEGNYYLYVSRRIYVYEDILSSDGAIECEIIGKGGAPSNCDWYSVNGGKFFRIDGVDLWFLAYQAGTCNPDFPSRFHVAWSEDLLNWTKVTNPIPFFTRGPRGAWDQGAIWAPSIFEYGDRLYLYYEGWGCEGEVADRDRQYFTPGHSQIGIASCTVNEFLKWCGIENTARK